MCDFAHLHVHSDGSRVDGLGPVARLVEGAKSLGFNHLGLTDHGSMTNAIVFNRQCKQNGIKPILGVEGYVNYEGERFHITLLANGNNGLRNVTKINNIGVKGDDSIRPTFPFEALLNHHEDVILLTGCPGSPLQKLEIETSLEIGRQLKAVYGNRMFAEVMFINQAMATWERSLILSEKLKIPMVLTNDVHFPFKQDGNAHSILTKLQAGFEYDSYYLFLATLQELRDRVKTIAPEFLPIFEKSARNSLRLAENIEEVSFNSDNKLPKIENAEQALVEKSWMGLNSIFNFAPPMEYKARLQEELDIICNLGFATYFIILEDIVKFAISNDIWIGPGRGSGAGSLVLFALGITKIDPVYYKLHFERFLNYKRAEMPDVDMDFESERRSEILDYAKTRWGGLPVATYSRWSHKSLMHDLARICGLSPEKGQALSDSDLSSEKVEEFFTKYMDASIAYEAMNGQIRHMGQHAGGIIVSDDDYVFPLEKTKGGDIVVAWTEGENRELSSVGLVKYDLLGLSAVSILKRLFKATGISPKDPVDNDPVFKIFQEGNLTGIFQFSGSSGIIEFTKQVSPNTFSDLIAINALYRPGALDSGAAYHYPEWKKNPRKIHPLVDSALEETYGVICFQEQFMQIYANFTGGELADADLARKVLTKARPGQQEWEEKFLKLKSNFFDGATARGVPQNIIEEVWGEVVTHTRYSFNASHATAYALIAWQLAWYKFHFPVNFYCESMNIDTENIQDYLFELLSNGYEITMPSVNNSSGEFTVVNGKIIVPLSLVKFLGSESANTIASLSPFLSVADFMTRVPKRKVNKRARSGLYHLGAFNEFADCTIKLLDVEEQIFSSDEERIFKFTDLFIPSSSKISLIKHYRNIGYLVGIIKEKERRNGKWGDYFVYKMSPSGGFWAKNFDLEEGELIAVKKKETGSALNVQKI